MTNVDGVEYEVYVMKVDGSEKKRITENSSQEYTPSWNPTGSRIVYRSNRDNNFEIYIMNADGMDETNLTNNSADDYQPMMN